MPVCTVVATASSKTVATDARIGAAGDGFVLAASRASATAVARNARTEMPRARAIGERRRRLQENALRRPSLSTPSRSQIDGSFVSA